MREITRDVWEGTDYVPFLWDEWLNDAHGCLQVATIDERVVGLQHIDVLPDQSAWAEGIRVADGVRGRGVGEALLVGGIRWARRKGCAIIRLSTASVNPASNRLAEKGGLRIIGQFDALTAEPLKDATEIKGVRLGMPSDVDEILRFLQRDTEDGKRPTFYTEGWTAHALSIHRLHLLLAIHCVLLTNPGEIDALGIATSTVRRPMIRLGLLRGSESGMKAIGDYLRTRAGDAGLTSVRATVQMDDGARAALHAAGFESRDMRMLLHERTLGTSEPEA